jgi:hypothetical protein
VEESKPTTTKPGVPQGRPERPRPERHPAERQGDDAVRGPPVGSPVPLNVGEGDRPTSGKPGTGR